jgi:PST family polysaccharide transporter
MIPASRIAVPGSYQGNHNVDWIEIVVKLGPESNNTDIDIAPANSLDVVAAPEQTSDLKKLDKALASGVAWTAGVKWISQILTWGMTLLVAHLLQPSDYGLIGMATIYLYFVQQFSEFALGTAVVTMQELSDDQISQLNSVSLLTGLAGFAISAALAVPVSRFYHAPQLRLVILVMSTAFLISAFSIVPNALLRKEMRFKILAVIEGLQTFAQAVSTLVLASLGFRYWALVLGNLSFTVAATILTLAWKRQRFARPRWSRIRSVLIYSWHIIVARLSFTLYDTSDFIVAGRVLGQGPLGNYNMAWTFAHAPLEKLSNMVNRVTPSIFAAAQTDYTALRRYFRNITGTLSLAVFPAVLGIALVANDFVYVALGQKWAGVVLPLELLTLHALLRSNVILLTPVLNVIGEERFSMWNSFLMLAVLVPSFYIGSHWGTGGIAGVWVFVYPVLALPLFWRLFHKINMPVGEYVGALWPAISGSILMAVAVELFKRFRNPGWPLYLDLALEILIGALVYALALVLMHRKRLHAFLNFMKDLRRPAN